MIAPGTSSSLTGKKPKLNSSEESQFLYLLIQAVNNNTSSASASKSYNTISQYELLNSATITHTFPANTIHSIKISVISGTADITFDGTTTVTYPTGTTLSFETPSTFDSAITITVPSGSTARTLIQTVS